MVFLTINLTINLTDFLGHNADAVRRQVWTVLLTYLLLRFCDFLWRWSHSFTRLFALIRPTLWQKIELRSLVECYGQPKAADAPSASPNKGIWPDSAEAMG